MDENACTYSFHRVVYSPGFSTAVVGSHMVYEAKRLEIGVRLAVMQIMGRGMIANHAL